MKKYIIAAIILLLIIIIGLFFYFNKEEEKILINRNIEYFEMLQGENSGVIDKDGNIIIEPIYSHIIIPDFSTDVFFCYSDNLNYKIVDKDGNELFKNLHEVSPIIGSLIERYEYRSLLKFKEEGKLGLIDIEGNRVTRVMYDKIEALDDDYGIYKVTLDGKIGLLDSQGKVFIQVKYDEITPKNSYHHKGELLNVGYELKEVVSSEPRFGFADGNGKIILKPRFESVFKTNIASEDYYLVVQEKGRKGLYKNNKRIIKSKYQEIAVATDAVVVKEYNKFGLYSLDGRELISPRFDQYKLFGKYITFVDDEKEYTYDGIGNQVAGSDYLIISDVPDKNYIIVADRDDKKTLIVENRVIDERFDDINYAFDDFFIFQENDKLGVFQVNKGEILAAEYDYITSVFGMNIIKAIKENETTLYNKELYLIDFSKIFAEERLLDEELLFIYTDNDAKYLDIDGYEVENRDVLENKYYAKKDGSKWGFVDNDDKFILKAKYDMVSEFNEFGFASVKLDDKWGVINKDLEEVVKPIYEFKDRRTMPKFVSKFLIEENITGLVIDIDKQEITEIDY